MEELNNEMMVENTVENEEEFENSNSGIVGTIAKVGLGIAGGVAAGLAVMKAKNSGKIEAFKNNRQMKKIERLERKLEKCYTTVNQDQNEVESKKDEA